MVEFDPNNTSLLYPLWPLNWGLFQEREKREVNTVEMEMDRSFPFLAWGREIHWISPSLSSKRVSDWAPFTKPIGVFIHDTYGTRKYSWCSLISNCDEEKESFSPPPSSSSPPLSPPSSILRRSLFATIWHEKEKERRLTHRDDYVVIQWKKGGRRAMVLPRG